MLPLEELKDVIECRLCLRWICFVPLMLFSLSLQHNFVACVKQVNLFL